jgi:hypothetical protein
MSTQPTFCRAAIGKALLTGHQATRFAVFQISRPPGEVLPTDTARVAEQVCRLKTVSLATDPLDAVAANAIAESAAVILDAKLGAHALGAKLSDQVGSGWTGSKTWGARGTTVVVGMAPQDRKQSSALKVVMVAYARGSSVEDGNSWVAEYRADAQERSEMAKVRLRDADSAIAWAGLPSIASDLRSTLDELRRPRGKSDTMRVPEIDAELVRAVRATRDTAPMLEPHRRAAALLAADLVRYAAVPYPPSEGGSQAGTLFNDLQSIVAGPRTGSGEESAFSRPWLWEAYNLDSLGRAGHIAFIRLLARGFDKRFECAQGMDFYNEMIRHGETALRRGDSDPMVHYYVATAYKDIYEMANRRQSDGYVDPGLLKPLQEDARLRAIDHFRAALVSLPDRSLRHDAWIMATTLLLRMPRAPMYFCASD